MMLYYLSGYYTHFEPMLQLRKTLDINYKRKLVEEVLLQNYKIYKIKKEDRSCETENSTQKTKDQKS